MGWEVLRYAEFADSVVLSRVRDCFLRMSSSVHHLCRSDPTPVFRLSSTDNRGQSPSSPILFFFTYSTKCQKIIDDRTTWVAKHC